MALLTCTESLLTRTTALLTCTKGLLTRRTGRLTCSASLLTRTTGLLTCTESFLNRKPGLLTCAESLLTFTTARLTCTEGLLTRTTGLLTCSESLTSSTMSRLTRADTLPFWHPLRKGENFRLLPPLTFRLDLQGLLQGYALGHVANAVRVAGDLVYADTLIAEARLQLEAGEDPDSVLDPGRLLDLEACLRRGQRRFDEAVTLLDQAEKVSRTPEKAMLNKGFTLEVMGEYGRAVETLQQAAPLVENQADRRLKYILRLNLANNFCHLGRFREAADLVRRARTQVADIGNTIDLIRILWLEGRIAAGLNRPMEALRFLTEARRRFAASGMSYDVALVLLEEAIVLLSQSRVAEVKALAQELIGCFHSKGVHREAQAALKLFVEAAAGEMATIELTRNLASYLHRARHDQNLQFDTHAKG